MDKLTQEQLEQKNKHLQHGEEMYIAMRNRCASVEAELAQAKAEIERLTDLISAVYMMAGAYRAPLRFLDALSAATHGEKFDTEHLLPVLCPEDEPRTDHDHANCNCYGCSMDRLEAERDTLRAQLEQMCRPVRDEVCAEIADICRVYREQMEERGYVDTPGGLEHMGDVWTKLLKWDAIIADRARQQEQNKPKE